MLVLLLSSFFRAAAELLIYIVFFICIKPHEGLLKKKSLTSAFFLYGKLTVGERDVKMAHPKKRRSI